MVYPHVAATATIKGAERDSVLMYGRELNIFPPPVAKASDNFLLKRIMRNEEIARSLLGHQTEQERC